MFPNRLLDAIWGKTEPPRRKYSAENLSFLHQQLLLSSTWDRDNRTIETLREISEILIWADQNDRALFDVFLEKNIHLHFLRILAVKDNPGQTVQLLQTLNIMFENIRSETSIYYFLSNNYVNRLITQSLDFRNEEIAAYYISFLKTLSGKLTPDTVSFFYNEVTGDFPLFTEAIKFFNHEDGMIRIAVRTLTLNVFKVQDSRTRNFLLSEKVATYFTQITTYIFLLARELHELALQERRPNHYSRMDSILAEHADQICYLNDLLSLGNDRFSDSLVEQISSKLLNVYIESIVDHQRRTADEGSSSLDPSVAIILLCHIFHQTGCRYVPLVSALATVIFLRKNISLMDAFQEIRNSMNPTSLPCSKGTFPRLLAIDKNNATGGRNSRPSTPSENIFDEADEELRNYKQDLDYPRMYANVDPQCSIRDEMSRCRKDGTEQGDVAVLRNKYRTSLIGYLEEGDVDMFLTNRLTGHRRALPTICLLYFTSKSVALPDVLVSAGLCPQTLVKSRRLLNTLTGDNLSPPSLASSPIESSPLAASFGPRLKEHAKANYENDPTVHDPFIKTKNLAETRNLGGTDVETEPPLPYQSASFFQKYFPRDKVEEVCDFIRRREHSSAANGDAIWYGDDFIQPLTALLCGIKNARPVTVRIVAHLLIHLLSNTSTNEDYRSGYLKAMEVAETALTHALCTMMLSLEHDEVQEVSTTYALKHEKLADRVLGDSSLLFPDISLRLVGPHDAPRVPFRPDPPLDIDYVYRNITERTSLLRSVRATLAQNGRRSEAGNEKTDSSDAVLY